MQCINYNQLTAMLLGAIDQVRANHELLSRLDSFGGDGDHGTTMLRAMDCLKKGIDRSEGGSIKAMLKNVSSEVMGVDGGATGPLFGRFFKGMALAAEDRTEIDPPTLAAMFDRGLSSVGTISNAQVGDKTMIDALVPAVEAAGNAAEAGADITALLDAAAAGALEGAESTKQLQARFGRAKNIGEKSIGQQDPGATSVSFVFRGFAEGVKSNG